MASGVAAQRTGRAVTAETEAPQPVRLDGLPADLICSIFCVCGTMSALAACAATCALFRGLVAASDAWKVLLWRNFDVSLDFEPVLDKSLDARDLLATFRRVAPQRLVLRGFLCDGGIDSEEVDEPPGMMITSTDPSEPALQLRTLPHMRASFWAANAFVDSDWRVYCSQSGERNISLVAAVAKSPDAKAESALERERVRRAYMIERLHFVAETLWAWTVNGFGGLGSCSTETLEHAMLSAWALPQGRVLLLHGIPASQRNRHVEMLASLVQGIAQRTPKQLEVWAGAWKGRRLMVDGEAVGFLRTEALALCDPPQTSLGCTADGVFDRLGGAAEGEGATMHLIAPPATLAVASHVVVRRGVMCSCPVQCGALLGSTAPLPPSHLYGAAARLWDDATSVDLLPPEVGAGVAARLPGVTVVECARRGESGAGGLFPIAWFCFDPIDDSAEAEGGEQANPEQAHPGFRFALAQPRALRYLVLKLISPEDRMVAMQDDHASPNIDLEYCGIDGWRLEPQGPPHSQSGTWADQLD